MSDDFFPFHYFSVKEEKSHGFYSIADIPEWEMYRLGQHNFIDLVFCLLFFECCGTNNAHNLPWKTVRLNVFEV